MTQQPTIDATLLVGTWRLKEAYAVDEEGHRLEDVYGAAPAGLITYGADRRMVALITHGGRPNLDGDREAAPSDQKAEAYTTSIAYAGTFDFDGAKVIHHVEVSTYPNWVGTDLVRFAALSQGDVVLRTTPQMQDGILTTIELVWTRVTDGSSGGG